MSEISPKVTTLIKRRNDLDISQRDLDKLIGVSDCMVAKWEAGHRHPTAASLERWAAALGMRLELALAAPAKRKKAS